MEEQQIKELHVATDKLFKAAPIADTMLLAKIEKARSQARTLAHTLIDVVPAGPERDAALLQLRQVVALAIMGCEAHPVVGPPRITAARIDEATAVAMRDGSLKLPGE